MSILMQLDHVKKIYSRGEAQVYALNDISLTVRQSEFIAFLGPSGCGKSTLMHILGCLDTPTVGRYLIEGTDVATLSPPALAALRCNKFGFIFQRYYLIATATAAENVEMPAIYAGITKSVRKSRAHQLLAQLELSSRAAHFPNQLSGGQQQRVSIARALINHPPVILADEPTGALDRASGQQVLQLLLDLHQEGYTILLITHDLNIAQYAQRIIHLRNGRIEADNLALPNPTRTLSNLAAPPQSESSFDQHHNCIKKIKISTSIAEAAQIAGRSLYDHIFRSTLALLGITLGVAAVVVMLAIAQGSRQQVLNRIAGMGTDLLSIRAGKAGSRVSGEVATLSVEDTKAIQDLPNILAVSPERSTGATIRHGNKDYRTTVHGVWPSYMQIRIKELALGNFFTQSDLDSYVPVIVLGSTVARNLFGSVKNPIGQYVLVSNIPFEVIGIIDGHSADSAAIDQNESAFIPITTGFMRIFGKQHIANVLVRVIDYQKSLVTENHIRQLLAERHGLEDFRIYNPSSMQKMAIETQNTFTVLLGTVAAISLFIGGVGVMNIMLVSVTERTREIGIRMATGATIYDILLQFNIEAIITCGVGGILGIIFGLVITYFIQYTTIPVVFSIEPPLIAFSSAFLTGCIFGYWPARKAAHLSPVLALSTE